MSNVVISPNMNLPVPIVGIAPGPEWATDINNCLNPGIDQHNHAPGFGVQINPDGLNINADLPFLGNNATQLRSVRFNPQLSPIPATSPDLGCLYEAGNDLYFNDGAGNQIRFTQSGSVVGPTGSITGLVPPASASYVAISETFIFQSDVNTPANIDVGSIIIRDITANSQGITITPPASLASGYTITLPKASPSQYSALTTNASGASIWQATYNAVVGSSAQVAAGRATHTSLTAAIAASSANWNILILQGAFTESPTISSTTLTIVGSGRNTVITGNLSLVSATYCQISGIQLVGNLSIDSGSSGNIITNSYIGSTNTATDNGSGDYIYLIQG